MSKLIAILPDPDYFSGDKRKEIVGNAPAEIVKGIREFITLSGYGSSAIGANFTVYRDGNRVAWATYNGKFHWEDPSYAADRF